ncbi:bifunctional (p)ppGpp synthetase/guanosine-3',5'-bis(diphosphate) 3'-pyrophosphohydrolase [bacterium]|nr:bifunctional (p)ppGpp synthetase/guanosine-3',5'-bis(diphosphate) 3'-pyrophosphohydrolase [bacterium]|tara:strand:+ start:1467 stop:3620 length:2154 start_codon:yes stop_codon:yes gene_type:complete
MIRLDNIVAKIRPYLTSKDIEEVKKAYAFSAKVHAGQKRYSGEPYMIHPMEVTSILADIKLDKESIITGLLHDTIEDTLATNDDIEKLFGKKVFNLVNGVTKIGQLKISSKFERQAENFRKLILATGKDIRVIIVKLADRLHNCRTIHHLPENKQADFAKETMDLYAPLADRLGIYWIRTELEDISFKILKPHEYAEIEYAFSNKKNDWEIYSTEIQGLLQDQLEKYGIKASIQSRFKNFYGIYKKMLSKDLDFNNVFDIKAFRVITNTESDCYAALGAVHSTWRPIPGRFKDYIALPKSNGYQSLHTNVLGPFGDKVEVQIRTGEMHEIAQYGIAAHWKYKLKDENINSKSINFPDSIQKIFDTQTLNDPKEFIDAVKDELITNFVYTFTPTGDLKELPIDSSIIDFAYSIHSDIGNSCYGGKVNGAIVPISYKLKSGDMVEIITKSEQVPKRDWLKHVVTSKAKTKIRSAIKTSLISDSIKIGKSVLSQKLLSYGINIEKKEIIEKLKEFSLVKKIKSLDDVYIKFSLSQINILEILSFMGIDIKNKSKTARSSRVIDSSNAIVVGGNDNVMVRFAKCCSPIYGDEIIGHITIGKGISIHRISCNQILEIDPSRRIEAKWDKSFASKSSTKLKVSCFDKPGILSEVSNTIAKHESNIIKINAKQISSVKSSIYIELLVRDAEHLNDIVEDLSSIVDVNNVERLRNMNLEQIELNL